MKKSFFYNVFTIGLLSFILIFISNPTQYTECVIEGLKAFFLNVLPCLFPFFVATKLLISLNCLETTEKIFYPLIKGYCNEKQASTVFFISLISGFPIGVSTSTQLYFDGKITKESCIKLSTLCNFAGPIFVLGTVGKIINDTKAAIILYISSLLGAITTALLFSLGKKKENEFLENKIIPTIKSNENIFNDAINQSISNILSIGGTITIFGIIANMIFSILPNMPPLANTIIYGIIEITGGCKLAANLQNKFTGIILCAGFLGFGGICIFLQTCSFWKKAKLNCLPFLLKKATQGVASMMYCFILLLLFY